MIHRCQSVVDLQKHDTSSILTFAIAMLSLSLPAVAQQTPSGQRQVNIIPLNLYAPVQVTAVLEAGHSFPVPRGPHQSVTLEDLSQGWLGDLSFTVENHSKKDIVVIEAEVFFAAWEDDPKHPQKVVKFHEGQLPAHALMDGNGAALTEESSLNFDVKPGASVAVPLKQALEKFRRLYPSPPVALGSVESVSIQIERVFFADGTMWAFNAYLKPDDSSPGRYVRDSAESSNR